MEKLFEYLIGAYFPKKYEIIPTLVQESSELRLKSSLAFVQTIERWTRDEESRIIPTEEVRDKSYTFLSQESIDQYCRYFDDRSVVSKMENLNTRLAAAIKLEMDGEDANVRKEMLKNIRSISLRIIKREVSYSCILISFSAWRNIWQTPQRMRMPQKMRMKIVRIRT